MEFEDILNEVGGYGKYQKYLTMFFLVPVSCILPWITINTLFMVSVPDHWCYVPTVASSNLSIVEQRALVSPPDDPRCTMYETDYTRHLLNNKETFNYSNITPCTSGWQFDKANYESTAATKWNMICNRSYLPSLVLTLQCVGILSMTPLYGYLADKFGRKTIFMVLAVICCSTELISVLVGDFISFVVLRTIHASVMPTTLNLVFIIIIEVVAPEMRAHMNGLLNCFWTLGLCFLPLLAYLTGNWIKFGFVCSFVYACIPLYWRFIPESPSWLISRGRYEEATKIMLGIAKSNGKSQDQDHLFKEIQTFGESIKKKKALANDSAYHILGYPRIRKHFIILAISWTAFNVAYYGPLFNLRNLAGNEFINFFLLSIVEVPGNFVFWILMDRAGRRWTTSIGLIIVGIFYLGPISGFQYSDIICSMIGKLISTGIFMVVGQQGSELFPTVARSFGMGLGKTVASTSTLWVPFLADLGADSKELPFVIMSSICIIAGVLAAFLPETLNENLPQTISDAEEFGKNQKFFSWKRLPHSNHLKGLHNLDSKTKSLSKDEITAVPPPELYTRV